MPRYWMGWPNCNRFNYCWGDDRKQVMAAAKAYMSLLDVHLNESDFWYTTLANSQEEYWLKQNNEPDFRTPNPNVLSPLPKEVTNDD